jgi:hypothetical protein
MEPVGPAVRAHTLPFQDVPLAHDAETVLVSSTEVPFLTWNIVEEYATYAVIVPLTEFDSCPAPYGLASKRLGEGALDVDHVRETVQVDAPEAIVQEVGEGVREPDMTRGVHIGTLLPPLLHTREPNGLDGVPPVPVHPPF